jgi:recombination protein RecT
MSKVNTESTKNKLAQQAQQAPARPESGMTLKGLLATPIIKSRFEEVLKNRSPQFMTSIINLYNSEATLQKSDPMSVISSAMIAASLDLPIDKNLGYAWIVAYWNNDAGKYVAQFQLGYKGYIQLALRTSLYHKINVIPIFEDELKKFDRLTEELIFNEDFDENESSGKVVGYAAYFELKSGFKKTVYWKKEQVENHRVRHNKAKDKTALNKAWREDYDAMAMKTVLKALLSKWGILSVEMQDAITKDEEETNDRIIINNDDLETIDPQAEQQEPIAEGTAN